MTSDMSASYATAKVCDYEDREKCDYLLEPDLEAILKDNKDYDQLAYYWTAWHDTMSNAVPAELYREYMDVANQLAQANGT